MQTLKFFGNYFFDPKHIAFEHTEDDNHYILNVFVDGVRIFVCKSSDKEDIAIEQKRISDIIEENITSTVTIGPA